MLSSHWNPPNHSEISLTALMVTDLLPLLQGQLVLAAGLEVVERHEQLRVAVLVLGADQEVLARGPAEAGALQRVQEAEAGEGGEVVLRGGRHLGERPVLQQSFCKNTALVNRTIPTSSLLSVE